MSPHVSPLLTNRSPGQSPIGGLNSRGAKVIVQGSMDRAGSILRVVSYNVHCGIDAYGEFRPGGIAALLSEVDADVVALQDVFTYASSLKRKQGAEDPFNLVHYLSGRTGLGHCQFLGAEEGASFQPGVGLISRYPLSAKQELTFPQWFGRPAQRALACVVEHPTRRFWVISVEMQCDPTQLEQMSQVRQLQEFLATLQDIEEIDAVVCGGFNALPCSKPVQTMNREMDNLWLWGSRQATFPSNWPILMLDYVFLYRSRSLVCESTTVKSSVASTHLPVTVHFSYSH